MDLQRKKLDAEKKLDDNVKQPRFSVINHPFKNFKDRVAGKFQERREERAYETYLNRRGLELSVIDLELNVKLKAAELKEVKKAERLEKYLKKKTQSLSY